MSKRLRPARRFDTLSVVLSSVEGRAAGGKRRPAAPASASDPSTRLRVVLSRSKDEWEWGPTSVDEGALCRQSKIAMTVSA